MSRVTEGEGGNSANPTLVFLRTGGDVSNETFSIFPPPPPPAWKTRRSATFLILKQIFPRIVIIKN